MASTEYDEYEVPLRDQRYFGAGLKRKRIQFVTSTPQPSTSARLPPTTSAESAADRYLAIVLGRPKDENPVAGTSQGTAAAEYQKSRSEEADPVDEPDFVEAPSESICDVCHRSINILDATTSHESSIVHQICLAHSHPPNHIDRSRKGLAVLESQGWDPDSRSGLGAEGKGRLYPVRATENPGKAGLGARFVTRKAVEKPVRLDAGKARLREKEGKRKAERLRNAFYRSEEVERYLGRGEVPSSLDPKAFERAKKRR